MFLLECQNEATILENRLQVPFLRWMPPFWKRLTSWPARVLGIYILVPRARYHVPQPRRPWERGCMSPSPQKVKLYRRLATIERSIWAHGERTHGNRWKKYKILYWRTIHVLNFDRAKPLYFARDHMLFFPFSKRTGKNRSFDEFWKKFYGHNFRLILWTK